MSVCLEEISKTFAINKWWKISSLGASAKKSALI